MEVGDEDTVIMEQNVQNIEWQHQTPEVKRKWPRAECTGPRAVHPEAYPTPWSHLPKFEEWPLNQHHLPAPQAVTKPTVTKTQSCV